jgi:hypothetical protein
VGKRQRRPLAEGLAFWAASTAWGQLKVLAVPVQLPLFQAMPKAQRCQTKPVTVSRTSLPAGVALATAS